MPRISALGGMSSRGFGEFNYGVPSAFVEDVFSVNLYTGTGTTLSIVNGIDLAGKGGLVWIKSRGSTAANFLFDTIRGPLFDLNTETTAASASTGSSLTSFNSNGFTQAGATATGANTVPYKAITFEKSPKFFDLVNYTGNLTARTIPHSLGVAPGMIVVKRTDSTSNWYVYHRSIENSQYLLFNTTAANSATGQTEWNSTTATDTVFSIGANANVNTASASYIAYLFAHDPSPQGAIYCGEFSTAAGGAATINIGWEPQFLIIKAQTAVEGWYMFDSTSGITFAGPDFYTLVNTTAVEVQGTNLLTTSATGFSVVLTGATTYAYMAIRRGPMRTPTDATKVFQPAVYTGTNVDNRLVDIGFKADMVMVRERASTTINGMVNSDRTRANNYNFTGTAAVQVNDADSFDDQTYNTLFWGNSFSSNVGFWVGNDATARLNNTATTNGIVVEAFARAPSFFDIVGWDGNGSTITVPHSLGVAPELTIVRRRNVTTGNWRVATTAGVGYQLILNSNAGYADPGADAIAFSSTWIELYAGNDTNASGSNYFAYLFASCPGVSKVSSYRGTGTVQFVDCGFPAGVRFLLIKRTDSTGNWYLWDSARGIAPGNDPYLQLNSTAAEVTTNDYVNTYSSGFEITNSAPAELNERPGITWNAVTSSFGTTAMYAVAYGNNTFVVGGNSGKIATSTSSARVWVQRTSQFGTSGIYGLAFGNGLFVAVGVSGKISTSPDGITWTARTSGTTSALFSVAYGNGRFVAVGQTGVLLTSFDGITWTTQTSGFGSSNINDVKYAATFFVAVGDSGKLSTSSDGITWASQTSGFGADSIIGVAYGGGIYVIGGQNGKLSTSTDGITWTARTSGFGTTFIYKIGYGNGLFVAVGASGTMTTSSDGVTWTARTSAFGTQGINNVGYGDLGFVAVGENGVLTTSVPEYTYLAIA